MTCDGVIVNAPAPRHVEDNVCKDCPKGFVCDGAKKTACGGTKFIDGNVCKDCPAGYTCAGGSRTKCGQTFGFESVRGWNTNIKSHDVVCLVTSR